MGPLSTPGDVATGPLSRPPTLYVWLSRSRCPR
jgi:hypothetical protein